MGLPLHYDAIGVAVLTMVDAKAAGVLFTINPINGDESKVALEASFGFGEAVVSGNVTPDRYLVDKVTLEIDERVISEKGSEFAYNPDTKEMEYKELPADRRKVPCLEDREILELTKIAKRVETHFGCAQDIEYSVSGAFRFPSPSFSSSSPESVWGRKERVGAGKEERLGSPVREGHNACQADDSVRLDREGMKSDSIITNQDPATRAKGTVAGLSLQWKRSRGGYEKERGGA